MMFGRTKTMVSPEQALPGRDHRAFPVPATHAVLGTPLEGPWPENLEVASFAMGCFWGAERIFWQTEGVHSTAVGYQGGSTPNPTYDEVCSGRTGHTETVQVVYDPAKVTYEALLKVFWESHDPTQGFRQGNDSGTQYRSAAFTTTPAQLAALDRSKPAYEKVLADARFGPITTEIAEAGPFFYAEDYHQQYLYKVPNGYCGIGGTGVTCPVGVAKTD